MTVALMRPFMAPPYAHYMSCFRAKSLKCNETIETSHTGKWISFFYERAGGKHIAESSICQGEFYMTTAAKCGQ